MIQKSYKSWGKNGSERTFSNPSEQINSTNTRRHFMSKEKIVPRITVHYPDNGQAPEVNEKLFTHYPNDDRTPLSFATGLLRYTCGDKIVVCAENTAKAVKEKLQSMVEQGSKLNLSHIRWHVDTPLKTKLGGGDEAKRLVTYIHKALTAQTTAQA